MTEHQSADEPAPQPVPAPAPASPLPPPPSPTSALQAPAIMGIMLGAIVSTSVFCTVGAGSFALMISDPGPRADGSSGADAWPSAPAAPSTGPTGPQSDDVISGPPPSPSGPPATPANRPPGIYQEGTLLVPDEVTPGTYRATVPPTSIGCRWERLRGVSGHAYDILAEGRSGPGTRVTVTILRSDMAFMSNSCGDWLRIG